jgi:putative ABC transport system permease protein
VALELGPILRSGRRHKGTLVVVVLQLAAGFVVVSWLLLLTGWVLGIGHQPVGFDETDLVMATVRAPGEPPALDRLAALPEVTAATSVEPGPRERSRHGSLFSADGPAVFGWSTYTTPALFPVLGVRFLEGSAPPVDRPGVVLTRRLRERLFPDGPCLGRMVRSDDAPGAAVTGVIEDVLMRTALTFEPTSVAFRFGPAPGQRGWHYLLRARPGRRDQVAAALAAALGPPGPARLVEVTRLGVTPSPQRAFVDGLIVLFALVGALLAVIAITGALALSSYLVAERTRQIGIRRALGATRWAVIRYFLVESAVAGALGVALGALLTATLYHLTTAMFPGMRLTWPSLTVTALLLWGGAVLAAYVPARRAAHISPSEASRP